MEQTKIMKDCEVEVSSEEEGFEGAWFRAILEETPTNSKCNTLRARYLTLLDEDGSSPLVEHIEERFIRPVPPKDQYNDIVLGEGVMVDANHKDGWWTGVVLEKMEDDKFLVYFDYEPDIMQFERKQLRAHLMWISSVWCRPSVKELDKSIFCSGRMVEYSSTKGGTRWVPAMIVKEIEEGDKKRFIMKDWNGYLRCNGKEEAKQNFTVHSHLVRPTPPPPSVDNYTLLEGVEVFSDSQWHKGLVREILPGERYKVSFKDKKFESTFKHSDLRPSMVWEDGAWHYDTEVSISLISTNITPQVTPIAKKSVTPIMATPLKQIVAETEGKKSPKKTVDPMKRQKGLENNSTQQEMPEKKNNKDESKKRKREHKCNSDLNETGDTCNDSKAETNDTSNNICVDDQPLSAWRTTELSSEPSPKVVKNSAVVAVAEEKQAKGTLTIFPFTKKMRFWKKYETDEVYKTMPQNPHFSPLVEVKEELREILAVGMMVRFHEALEEVEDLKLDVSSNTLSSLGSFFAHVEQHGFDVAAPQSRINKVLSLQEAKKAERQSLEKKIEIEEIKRHKIEAEVVELESKILELKEKSEAAGKMIVEMKSRAETIDQEIGHNPAL